MFGFSRDSRYHHMRGSKPDWNVLDRYLLGEESADDRNAMENYQQSDGEILREVLAHPFEYPEGRDPGVIVAAAGGLREPPAMSGRAHSSVWRYISIVAVLAIVIAGIEYFPIVQNHSVEPKTYSTVRGQRATITLLDGSIVKLAPATTIQVRNRDVELTGEAVFTVTQHSGSPFIVRTNNTLTKVLGTTFGIRAYTDQVRIIVAEGKISVSDPRHLSPGHRPGRSMHTLIAGDAAEIDALHTTISHNNDISTMLAWTSGTLVFENALVADVITDLERSFDLQIAADNSTLSRKVTISIRLNDPPREVVSTLAMALGAKVVWNGNRAVLK